MKTIALVLSMTMLSGCAVLSAMGIGPSDLAPSLRYCHQVSYERVGTEVELNAKCRVPAG